MIEYAILLILMIGLIVGGAELAVSAYQSSKTGDAAKAGANEWAEAIAYSISSNLSTLENENLLELYRQSLGIDTNTALADRAPDGTLNTAASCDVEPSAGCPAINLATNVRPVINGHCTYLDTFTNYDITLPIDITGCAETKELFITGLLSIIDDTNINPGVSPNRAYEPTNASNPQHDFDKVCTSLDNADGIEKIVSCRPTVNRYGSRGGVVDIYDEQASPQDDCVSGSQPCPDGNDDNGNIDLTDQFDADADGKANTNGNEGGATQTTCLVGPAPCADRFADIQSPILRDYYGLRGDTDGDGVVNNNTDIFDQNVLNEVSNGDENALDQTSCDDGSPSCPDGIIDVRGAKVSNGILDQHDVIDDVDPTFRRLLINKALGGINIPPIKQGVQTVAGVNNYISLGDHNNLAAFTRPSCSAAITNSTADYSDGLPNDGRIYLFNPLPIDITNCTGRDANRGNRSRLSILVGGYTDDPTPDTGTDLNYIGLPKINQAMYSQYTKVCVTENAGVISYTRDAQNNLASLGECAANGGSVWLKPPGKMCGAGTNNLSEFCPGVGNLNGASGFYLLGRSNNGPENQFTPSVTLANANAAFRPTFQIVCGGGTHQATAIDPQTVDDDNDGNPDDDGNAITGDCFESGTGSFSMEVHTRYRSIYESFLTFGIQAISNTGYLPYFYNPNKVGILNNKLVGIAGSEIGPLGGDPLRPTIKQFKDFRGCYRVEITPPDEIGEQVKTSVSSCN